MTTTGIAAPAPSSPASNAQDTTNNRHSAAVDVARDSTYCPQDTLPPPKPAPRGNPPTPKPRSVLPPSATSSSSLTASHQQTVDTIRKEEKFEMQQSPRSKQRLIKVDFSLLQDDNIFDDSPSSGTSSMLNSSNATTSAYASQPKMPPYPIGGYLCNEKSNTIAPPTAIPNSIATRVLRRTKDTITEDEYHRFFDNALESYDLATQCESRRASMRRHTIVGCQSNLDETHSMPPSRPESRQSDIISIAVTDSTLAGAGSGDGTNSKHGYPLAVSNCKQQQAPKHIRKFQPAAYANTNEGASKKHQQQQQIHAKFKNTMEKNAQHNLPAPAHEPNFQQQQNSNDSSQMQSPGTSSTRSSSSIGATWTKSFLDEKHWTERGDDRLSLTLEEIVHIRSVMTKAELEGLPVGVRVKEDVEKRKVCFLCLRTRFSIFGPWGIQCKLCQRTVCSKCYTKMRIPTEHFRNVPVVLISPSLLSSPAGSSTPSPSHHAQHIHTKHSSSTGNILDEAFPKSLIERLLRSESERKNRHTVGSVPSSPKHQRSNMSTPGAVVPSVSAAGNQHQELFDSSASNDAVEATDGYDKENADIQHQHNGGGARPSGAPPATATNKQVSIMSRSMEGPRSLPVDSPARTHSNSSTLDRKSKFARAFTLSSSSHLSADQKENIRGELMAVCNDCEGLLLEIIRSSKQTRSSARNRALKNLTLDLSPVYK